MQRITRSVFLHMEISWQLHCLNVVMYLYYYMFPAGFKYILQIKFLIDLNPGSAISVPAKHWYNVLVLCFKEQLLFTAGSLSMFPPHSECAELDPTQRNGNMAAPRQENYTFKDKGVDHL